MIEVTGQLRAFNKHPLLESGTLDIVIGDCNVPLHELTSLIRNAERKVKIVVCKVIITLEES